MKSFAILLICYNRIEGLIRLIASLENVDFNGRNDITLIFSIDYSGSDLVERFANQYKWPNGEKIIICHNENLGLKKHILLCGDLTNQYDILVVLEDDLYISPSMYNYAYNAACFYEEDDNIAGISLYTFEKNWINTSFPFSPAKSYGDIFFMKIAQSWGQVWQKKKWKGFIEWLNAKSNNINTDEKYPAPLNRWNSSNSWLKFHDLYLIDTNKFFVYPYKALSTNFSGSGVHTKKQTNFSQSQILLEKAHFSFVEFDNENAIKYDEFMERLNLGKSVGVDNQDLVVDLYGNKIVDFSKRFLLTTCKMNFKILKAYALDLKPIELNVEFGLQGKDIFLYDTKEFCKNKGKSSIKKLLKYYYVTDNIRHTFSIACFYFQRLVYHFFAKILVL